MGFPEPNWEKVETQIKHPLASLGIKKTKTKHLRSTCETHLSGAQSPRKTEIELQDCKLSQNVYVEILVPEVILEEESWEGN